MVSPQGLHVSLYLSAAAVLAAAVAVAAGGANEPRYANYQLTQERLVSHAPSYYSQIPGAVTTDDYYSPGVSVAVEGSQQQAVARQASAAAADPAQAAITAIRGRRKLQQYLAQSVLFLVGLYFLARVMRRGKSSQGDTESAQKEGEDQPPKAQGQDASGPPHPSPRKTSEGRDITGSSK